MPVCEMHRGYETVLIEGMRRSLGTAIVALAITGAQLASASADAPAVAAKVKRCGDHGKIGGVEVRLKGWSCKRAVRFAKRAPLNKKKFRRRKIRCYRETSFV